MRNILMKNSKNRRNNFLSLKLTSIVKVCLENRYTSDDIEWEATNALCSVIEAIFVRGLREEYFAVTKNDKCPMPNFWPFISKFTHPNIKAQICNLSQIRNDFGRGRAWLRLTLNDCLLENYVTSVCRETGLVKRYYHNNAYLLDNEEIEVFRNVAASLSKLSFNAPVNANLLNTWTNTPLKLAGYSTDGKIALPKDENQHLIFDLSSAVISVEPIDENEEVEMAADAISALENEGLTDAYLTGGNCDSDSMSTSEVMSTVTTSQIRAPDPKNVVGGPLLTNTSRSFTYADSESVKSSTSSTFTETNPLRTYFPSATKRTVAQGEPLFDERFMQILNSATPGGPAKNALLKYNEDDEYKKSNSSMDPKQSSPAVDIFEDRTISNDEEKLEEDTGSDQDGSHENETDTRTLESEAVANMNELQTREISETTDVPGAIEIEPSSNESQTVRLHSLGDEGRKSSDESEVDDLGSPYPRGNSLMGKRGWSCGALAFQNEEPSVSNRFYSSSPGTSFSDRQAAASVEDETTSNFAATIFRVFNETLSKFKPNENGAVASSKSESTAVEKLAPFGDSGHDEKSSGYIDSSPETAYKNVAKTLVPIEEHQFSAESDYIIVEKVIVNIEPAEKIFRTSCITKFSHEVGLSEQDFKCFTCRKGVGLIFGPYRICEFDGRYYCLECHLNEESIVPYRVVTNWDFKPRKVSRASKAFLDYVSDQPLLRLDKLNPSLVDAVQKLYEVRQMRLKLSFAAMYMLTCRETVSEDFKKRVFPKEYLYDEVDLYSLSDLKNILNGLLQKQLKTLTQYAIKHVLESCRLCASKGYLCEICNSPQPLYPFQFDIAKRCSKCYSVYHVSCCEGRPCPKCIRRDMYSKSSHDSGVDVNP